MDSTSPTHLVIVSPYRHANAKAGARVRAENLCRDLASRRGLRVTAVAPFPLAPGAAHVEFDLEGGLAARIAKLVRLNLLLHRLRPAIVVSESPLAPLAFGRFKVVHVIHDTKYITAHGRRGSMLARILYAASVRIADRVMTVSKSEAANIEALYGCRKKLIVSYNGISPAWFERPAAPPNCRYDIIYISNFARHKGHLDLLRATRDCPYRMALVGADFGEGEAITKAARESRCSIEFLGGLEEAELIALCDASRVMVFPSRLEGFGMPFLEARSRGLPVVANDIPVFRELASLLGGTIVDCSDTDKFAAAIGRALAPAARIFPDPGVLDQFRWLAVGDALLQDLGVRP
jgi:glycosyltransferase involved in cell wall biosynthesis